MLGAGPGQSAVLLTQVGLAGSGVANTRVLISAQGIWAAALLDGGVVAFCFWMALFGSVLGVAGRALVQCPALGRAATFMAASVVVAQVMISGDRLFPRHWLLLGLALAASSQTSGDDRRNGHQQTSA